MARKPILYPIAPVAVAELIYAMRLLENLTSIGGAPCVTFRPAVPSDGYYSIFIYSGTGCSSYVSRKHNNIVDNLLIIGRLDETQESISIEHRV